MTTPAADPSPDAPTTVPKAVLFDFGGVITTSPFEAFARYEADHGLPVGLIRSINATNPDTNAWAKLERSEVDAAGFGALFTAEAAERGHTVDGGAILGLISGAVRPEMVEALRRISGAGFTVACLTNNFRSHADGGDSRPETAQVMDMFDAVIESSVIGIRKPEPEFYRRALDIVGVDATEAVFLDDLGINLKPAKAMGMTTIKVVDPAEARAELGRVLGLDLG
ncbi:MAG: HAD-IA family hydrolase [Acidimicrobiales bacterium]